ncbi:hypothetical protein CFP65_3847 [Kitasatospora sp. MMS16-BH015]|uniref:hypothetical protein n=1 Tax=Kitasatospora sp. MMS16-BH015 TaxID=2018025 RepID=UPI000CA1B26F|nr:hypothetical protein [Kitasatospora sp. MMS16-BH015]AUG78627.1 hypothetical protein CFP65_3847 [Kitasatospora sp. MMS16-BH015]
MPLRDELPPRTGPWASRFDSEEALVKADDALRAAALRDRDLAPVLPYGEVYGYWLDGRGNATAIAIDPAEPYGADGELQYVYGDFLTGAHVYGVYRPAAGVGAQGPAGAGELWNTTLYPYPGGSLDPVTVPLAELGLDVPGVDRRFVNFCAGVLGVEAVDDLGMLKETFGGAWPDYREVVRAGLAHLARQPMPVEQWYALTYVAFPDRRALGYYLAQVYAYLFDGFDAMPVAPQ